MNKLEQQLNQLQYTFDSSFEQIVMQKLSAKTIEMWPNLSWMLTGVAATIIFCLGFVYVQEGAIYLENILGLQLLDTSNFTDILTYY
jgi:hypothetical protein